MNVGEILSLGVSIVAILGFVITFYQFSAERRKHRDEVKEREVAGAVKEAETARKIEQMEKDLNRAYGKIGALETVGQQSAIALAEIKVEMRTIRESTQRMEGKLDGHIKDGGALS